ncbi:Bacterial pre-peptidase C-terminal domain protein [Solibacillus isronensis B3W22]|uniref:Bacterial pre-peptidase C-terminal domain protein n=1 Tax=Solibacillus isronensis B3W22 TaxID=1224748 RepID=K1LPC5_9BACL|nr:Ig-like domain-containing protein [Solibacillus isronensis]EKB46039.1 Bacterial pre-peptidase C-terminal domain protein [Solibacillus isronensis B3W22]
MNRFFTLVITFILLMLFNTSIEKGVKAASNYEQEPNDEMKSATNIELNTTYSGYSNFRTSGSWGSHIGDFDYFKFTLDKPGKVTLSMKNNEDYTWSFLLTDSNNKQFIDADTENGVKVTDQNISHTTRSVGLPAGTYYVRVYGNYGEMEKIPYELTIGFKPSSRYEQEPNDEMKLATNIELNTTYTGYSKYLSSGSWGSHIGDFDYFKFKLDKSSEVTVSMNNHEDYTWSFLLLDPNNKKFIDAKTENGTKIGNKKSTNKSVSLPAGTYYVKVFGNYSEMEEIPYSLLVKKSILLTINKVTNKTTSITGKTEENANVEVKIGNKLLGKAKSDSKGNYKVKIKAQKKGTKLTVIARDKDKNEKTITTTVK